MHIHITPRHLKLTSALHSYVAEKIGHAEDVTNDLIAAHVVLWDDEKNNPKKRFVVKVHLSLPGPDIHAEDREDDLYKAIDKVSDIILQQLRKRKTKLKHNKRHKAQLASERAKSGRR
ncbi:ribosome-associated translation inhibitor RaiA [Kamptonema cortianum]|nr:ribosome-associated translation inhibitor RaiA [Kamptonema cortianum]MDL5050047.1 ribosome-associated translation inhibitor RaiA [Oscillatoria amoena NRMC-F 0135]